MAAGDNAQRGAVTYPKSTGSDALGQEIIETSNLMIKGAVYRALIGSVSWIRHL